MVYVGIVDTLEGSYLCSHNNLLVICPELCKEWDHGKILT
jgi:hypothetical protein